MPKLILQPIVENSIIHGLEGRSDGHIKISALKKKGQDGAEILEITVTDNGKGIDDEMIALIEADDPEALKGHLGIKNVNTIIRLYYGKEYGVHAERMEAGTKMTVTVPFTPDIPEGRRGEI